MFRPHMLAIPAAVIIGALAILAGYVATAPGDAATPGLASVEAGESDEGSPSQGTSESGQDDADPSEGGIFSNRDSDSDSNTSSDSNSDTSSAGGDSDTSSAGGDSGSDSGSNSDTGSDSDSDTSSSGGDSDTGDSDADDSALRTPGQTAPVFVSFSVSTIDPCPAVGPQPDQPVTVSWSVEGATSIYLAIDNEYGPYESGLPASGSLEVPGPGCIEPNTYYVVAENSGGRTVRQATRTPVIEELPEEPEPEPVKPPVFSSFSVSKVVPCETPQSPSPGPVTVSWSVQGVDSVYLAIDNEYGPYETGLPASGSLEVPGPTCNDDNTYYVVAENEAGRVVKQSTRTGVGNPSSLVGS